MSINTDCPTFANIFKVCDLEPFVSQVTQTDPPTGHSVELMKEEIERYLQRLVEAICDDLTQLRCAVNSLQSQLDSMTSP